jgi:replication factor C subunit 1
VEKYKPSSSKGIIGQQGDSSNMRKLTNWIKNWESNNAGKGKNSNPKPPPWNSGADNGFWAKAALLSGPPGIGCIANYMKMMVAPNFTCGYIFT